MKTIARSAGVGEHRKPFGVDARPRRKRPFRKTSRHRLDDIVTSAASQLMDATAATAAEVRQQVLASLAEQFEADACCLSNYDRDARATKLIAEWPPRPNRPYPGPLDVVHIASADPVFSYCADAKGPVVIRPDPTNCDYQAYSGRTGKNRRNASLSVAVAPLVSRGETTGLLGFVKFGGRGWKPKLLNTLKVIAPLFAQLQDRIVDEQKLRYLAEHDDLTGLRNRRSLVAHLSGRLAEERSGSVAVLYLDLDRLKSINDYFGHTAGDRYLQLFADRLRKSVGRQGMIGRYGGDEFIFVPDQSMPNGAAESVAEQLRATLHHPLEVDGHVITPSVSIGVAVGSPRLDTVADLLRRADAAVLAAKRGGGNQVTVSTDAIFHGSLFRNEIELNLQSGIDSGALLLHYLPEVDLRTGLITGVEALVRWRHRTHGLLPPDSFIGVAESTNLAGELGRWVMRSACAEFRRWRSQNVGQDIVLRVNVSPRQLALAGFVRRVSDTLYEFGIDAASVGLEITEGAVVRDVDTTSRTLRELKELGVEIAIDDFGTGYAVLSHLKSLPVDELKIDTGFVHNLGANPEDLAIVRAIIGLADAFGLETVAEGVETPLAAATLMQHGCYRAQGFLLSRPVTGDAMETLLTAGRVPLPFLADKAGWSPKLLNGATDGAQNGGLDQSLGGVRSTGSHERMARKQPG